MLTSCLPAHPQTGGLSPAESLHQLGKVIYAAPAEGIYRIDTSPLHAATKQQPAIFSLASRNLPVSVMQEKETLYFYNPESTSKYTTDNYYVLSKSAETKSVHPIKETPSPAALPESPQDFAVISTTLRIEKNAIYLPNAADKHHWYMERFVAPENREISFSLGNLAKGNGTIALVLYGATDSSQPENHHIQVSINSTVIGDVYWKGRQRKETTLTIPSGVLKTGKNSLTLKAPGDTGAIVDVMYLDRIDIEAPSVFGHVDTQQKITVPGDILCNTGSHPEITLFDVTSPEDFMQTAMPQSGQTSCIAVDPGHTYIAVPRDGFFTPEPVALQPETRDLRSPQNDADYLIISPPSFFPAIEPLIEYRKADGLKPMLISSDDLYTEFNAGYPEPEAIQNFLRYASTRWAAPPKYVLLVGDTTYDPKGFTSHPLKNQLPAFFVTTSFSGETSSDIPGADLDDDAIPDIALGRMPADSPKDIETALRRIFAFEKAIDTGFPYLYTVFAIADPQENTFQNDADHFLAQFPPGISIVKHYTPNREDPVTKKIPSLLDKGILFTAYFGHGSIDMWGKDNLLNVDSIDRFDNQDKPTIVLNFTCLTGFFTHPKVQSITEKWLFHPGGGAVAVIAPSSLTLPGDQAFLSKSIVESYTKAQAPRIGDLMLYAWRHVPVTSETSRDVLSTFMLFGDPALKLPPLPKPADK